ncbi:uncharacterized protein LOC120536433 [Polypterus senegalus]|uniref:uncharacterized protein LOC120536433 n=1 Tax=Polypterus senegalus TaxID=55291 RepID=UPI00196646D6|nr:uncharacterized protein LOC120536433 [Polypterus senegalus]
MTGQNVSQQKDIKGVNILKGLHAAVNVFVPQRDVVAVRNSDALLQCSFSVVPGPIDLSQLKVTWLQYGFPMAKFENSQTIERKDATLLKKEIMTGNVSLLLQKTVKRDEGPYECEVEHKGQLDSATLVLSIRVPPEVTIFPESVKMLSESTMVCSAKSFYPKQIRFIWTRSKQTVEPFNVTEPRLNPDGTFSAESFYRFTPTSRDDLTCEVQHEALKEPLRRSVAYVGLTGTEIVFIIFLVIAVIFIVFFALWFYSVSLSPLVPMNLLQNEPGEVKCTLTGLRLRQVTLQWFINDKAVPLDAPEVGHGDSEDDVILPLNAPSGYSLRRDALHKGWLKVEEQLTLLFTPSMSEHQRATVKCRATHGLTRRSSERTATLGEVYVRPHLSDIHNISQVTDTDVKLQIRAEKFHPQYISIVWLLGGIRVPTNSPNVTKNPDGNFSACSICSFTRSQVQSPDFKVTVEVEHKSIGKVEKTATSDTPGIDGRPQLSEIEVFSYTKVGKPCSLGCTISRFFPRTVTVTWQRNGPKTGHKNVTAGLKDWAATVSTPSPVIRNNFCEVISEVLFTPQDLSELEEMTYTCMVEHVTLDKPMEKQSRKLQLTGVKGRPRVSNVQVHFIEFGRPCILTCTVSDFYPKEINVTWQSRQRGTQATLPTSHYGPSMRGDRYALVSQAEFTPWSLRDLDDMEVVCRVDHETLGGKPIEESCSVFPGVNRCPLVSDIKVAECKGLGQPCTLSCSITNFYPKDIKVTWQRTGDKGPDITAVPSECQSGKQSYQLEAKATFVPKTQSDLEEVEYICRVEHETLNGQYFERRTGKTGQRDLLCCPVVSDIETIKCAKLSQPCVLGCSIRDFYPEEIEVTWLRRDLKTGNEFHSGTAGWTAEVDAKQEKQNNNTYSVKTQVTFTPETLNDVEEVEYICRVQHKSLSTPVDKHSGRIQITGLVQKPKVSEVEVNFIQFYQPCILTCQVSDFYPKEISITWEKKKKMMKGLLKCVDEWRPLVTQDGPSWNNYRYTLESRAEFTPQSQADLQDMEFICRVEHSSLRGPVEKQGSFAAVLALTGLQAKGSGDQEDQPQNRASEKRKTPKEPADDSKTESPSG